MTATWTPIARVSLPRDGSLTFIDADRALWLGGEATLVTSSGALRPDGPQEAPARQLSFPDNHTNTTHNRVGSHPRPCSIISLNISIPETLNTY